MGRSREQDRLYQRERARRQRAAARKAGMRTDAAVKSKAYRERKRETEDRARHLLEAERAVARRVAERRALDGLVVVLCVLQLTQDPRTMLLDYNGALLVSPETTRHVFDVLRAAVRHGDAALTFFEGSSACVPAVRHVFDAGHAVVYGMPCPEVRWPSSATSVVFEESWQITRARAESPLVGWATKVGSDLGLSLGGAQVVGVRRTALLRDDFARQDHDVPLQSVVLLKPVLQENATTSVALFGHSHLRPGNSHFHDERDGRIDVPLPAGSSLLVRTGTAHALPAGALFVKVAFNKNLGRRIPPTTSPSVGSGTATWSLGPPGPSRG